MTTPLTITTVIDQDTPAVLEMRRVLGELARVFAPRCSTHDLAVVMMTLAGDAGELHMQQNLGQLPVAMHEALRLHALLGQRLIQKANFLGTPVANQVPV